MKTKSMPAEVVEIYIAGDYDKARDLGKSAVLIEREEKYCEIAAKRMSQEVLPLYCENDQV